MQQLRIHFWVTCQNQWSPNPNQAHLQGKSVPISVENTCTCFDIHTPYLESFLIQRSALARPVARGRPSRKAPSVLGAGAILAAEGAEATRTHPLALFRFDGLLAGAPEPFE